MMMYLCFGLRVSYQPTRSTNMNRQKKILKSLTTTKLDIDLAPQFSGFFPFLSALRALSTNRN